MFNALLHKISAVLVIPAIAVLHYAGYYNIQKPLPTQHVQAAADYSLDISHLKSRVSKLESETSVNQNLGATFNIPTSVAIFSTSLQSAITSSANSMTLVSATYNNGASTLASSTYDFVIDEGTASQEFVSADCTATVCTNMQRGLDWITGTTTVSALQFAHRRAASVKITDAPILLKLTGIANGTGNYARPVFYSSSVSTSTLAANRNSLASAGLVADTAFSGAGIINASSLAKGVVQTATGLQIASSTGTCSSTAPCVVSADNATSTYGNGSTSGLKVVVTQNSGKIDPNFISGGAGLTLTGTTTMASTTINTYNPIGFSTKAYATSTSAMTLMNIPATLSHFRVFIYASTTSSTSFYRLVFNGDSAASYSYRNSLGSNTSPNGITCTSAAQSYIDVFCVSGSPFKGLHILDIFKTPSLQIISGSGVAAGLGSAYNPIATTTLSATYSTNGTSLTSITSIHIDTSAVLDPTSYIEIEAPTNAFF